MGNDLGFSIGKKMFCVSNMGDPINDFFESQG
jgi:hypothetical protein